MRSLKLAVSQAREVAMELSVALSKVAELVPEFIAYHDVPGSQHTSLHSYAVRGDLRSRCFP
jgi:hypothetical protein